MVKIQDLTKYFYKGKSRVVALSNIEIELKDGSWTTVIGKSGSGKSTLLYSIAGLIKPTAGKVEIDGLDVYCLPQSKRARLRGEKIGFIFQSFHLFPHLNVLQNVLISGGSFRKNVSDARNLLHKIGLKERETHMPSELSVGEKQRVAMARAVFSRPSLILADEATGNLDSENGRIVVNYLREFNKEGISVVFVTHKPKNEFEGFSHRILMLEKGSFIES